MGLQIVDVTDPQNPVIAGSLNTMAKGVYVTGNYAYIADWDWGLQIVDVSDPQNPVIAGSLDTAPNPLMSNGVYVSGNYAYIADEDTGLQIISLNCGN